jgi:hypothetical protein
MQSCMPAYGRKKASISAGARGLRLVIKLVICLQGCRAMVQYAESMVKLMSPQEQQQQQQSKT